MAPDSDEKSRFTAMLAGAANGIMLPAFIIIKCSSAKADLSNTRVLKTLLETDGFRAQIFAPQLCHIRPGAFA